MRGLTKRFGEQVAVAGIDLELPAGRCIGLVGPNGAGKTTTLSMLTGLLRPDQGTAEVAGFDVWRDPVEVKSRIGVLPEGLRLFERLSGRELLAYTGGLRGLPGAEADRRAARLLDVLDLAGARHKLLVDCSPGMRRRLGLAAALLHSPEILFLDEPFEGVDPVSAQVIRGVLERYTASGATVVLSSHVMALAESLCDWVAVMAAGRVRAHGPLAEVRGDAPSLQRAFPELVGATGRDAGPDLDRTCRLARLMTSPDGSTLPAAGQDAREVRHRSRPAGPGRLLPQGRTGATVERGLRYAWRDPRTRTAWVTSLAIGLIVPVFNALQNTGSVWFACFAAGMLGVQMYNQFGPDASAFWMVALTIASPRDAYVELRGRALALLVISLPYATLVTVLTTAMLGDWPALPGALGLSFALLGAMLATGAWSSARFPYPVPQEGHKNVTPGQAGLAWIPVFGGMVAAALLCLPVIALTVWLHLVPGGTARTWLLLPLGTAYGAGVGFAGLRLAAPRTARRLPEILAAVGRG
ncbi:hypothetical protein GCM10010145_01880 [Streptomyces ruber]|uniref:ABC transporter domain-containing protein n=1 Tax=Streptomyces ruber TaxID=83378 RepID=A0A918EPS6_9ACTN|nr:hypothetical protein GCM10010145_01880 [Streptomyces ruber]